MPAHATSITRLANPRQTAVVLVVDGLTDDGAMLTLSDEEMTRAARYRAPEAAQAYRLQHHLLRQLLAIWSGQPAEMLQFRGGPQGKPFLCNSTLHFNLSGSGNALAFYFGSWPGGIDIEICRASQTLQDIVGQHFHPNEKAIATSDAGFFHLWTRKEAVLKLIGCGVVDDLAALDCSAGQTQYREHQAYLLSRQVDRKTVSLALHEPPAQPVHWLTLDYATGRLVSAHHSLHEPP